MSKHTITVNKLKIKQDNLRTIKHIEGLETEIINLQKKITKLRNNIKINSISCLTKKEIKKLVALHKLEQKFCVNLDTLHDKVDKLEIKYEKIENDKVDYLYKLSEKYIIEIDDLENFLQKV